VNSLLVSFGTVVWTLLSVGTNPPDRAQLNAEFLPVLVSANPPHSAFQIDQSRNKFASLEPKAMLVISGEPTSGARSFLEQPLKAGFYETQPYSCLLAVPEPVDEQMVKLPKSEVLMPMLVPELQLRPRGTP